VVSGGLHRPDNKPATDRLGAQPGLFSTVAGLELGLAVRISARSNCITVQVSSAHHLAEHPQAVFDCSLDVSQQDMATLQVDFASSTRRPS